MSIRMRRPEDLKIDLSRGDWILVKKYLNAGEKRKMLGEMLNEETNKIKGIKIGVSRVQAYLLDWTFQDPDGKPLVIKDQSEDIVASALDGIDDDAFEEVLKAVDAHIEAMDAARQKEKASPFGSAESKQTLPSADS